ncbi:hypothetical protein RCH22_004122 [Cryobacterium psychrotolerans]|nr:hypothetical protein [Cryobacterium psychrotolerans]
MTVEPVTLTTTTPRAPQLRGTGTACTRSPVTGVNRPLA